MTEAARRGRVPGLPGVLATLVTLSVLLGPPPAAAQFIVDAVPGGLVEIPLAPVEQERPDAFFGQERVLVTRFARRWSGLVGLPLTLVPGRYVIQARTAEDDTLEQQAFTVYPARGEGHPPIELPGPPPEALETDFTWREPLAAALPLDAPVALPAHPTFGRHRQDPEDPEAGSAYADFVVFSIRGNLIVRTPEAGRIAATVSHDSGIYMWIDHGMALYTRLGPLSDTPLAPEAELTTGQTVGRVRLDEDETPRFLYLSVFLNGAAVDPFLIFEMEKADGPVSGETG